jgi:hypothetical protein
MSQDLSFSCGEEEIHSNRCSYGEQEEVEIQHNMANVCDAKGGEEEDEVLVSSEDEQDKPNEQKEQAPTSFVQNSQNCSQMSKSYL